MWRKFSKRAYLLVALGAGIGVGLTLLIVFLVSIAKNEDAPSLEATQTDALFPTLSPHAEAEFDRDISGDCQIGGMVRTDQDKPVKDAEVGIRILWEPWADPQPPARVKTDGKGQFAFKGLSRDYSYQLWVYSPSNGIAQYTEPECGARTEIVLSQGSRLTLRFKKPDGSAPGKVHFLLAGDLLWPAREGTTNEQGQIHIIGLEPGEYVLWASSGYFGYISDQPVTLEPGREAVGDIELLPAADVVITVLDSQGRKYSSGAIVSVASSSTSLLRRVTTTDNKGRATVKGLPQDAYAVAIVAPGHIVREAMSLRPGDEVTLRLAKGGSILGHVRLEDGTPVSLAQVTVEEDRGRSSLPLPAFEWARFKRRILVAEKNGFPPLYRVDKNTFTPGPVNIPLPELKNPDKHDPLGSFGLTDKEGGFVLDGLTAGRLVLGAKHEDYITVQKLSVTLEEGKSHSGGVIVLRSGMTARIRIVDERGYPIPDAEINGYNTIGEVLSSAASGSDGFATIKGLPEFVRIEATASGRVPAFIEIRGKLGVESTGEIALPPADKTLFGRAIDQNGFGLGEVDIVARATSEKLLHVLTAKTDSDGTFRIDEVGAGKYDVTADGGERGRTQFGNATFHEEVKLVIGGTGPSIEPARPVIPAGGQLGQEGANEWLDSRYPPENLGAEPGSSRVKPAEPTITEFGAADSLPVTSAPRVVSTPRGKGGLPLSLSGRGKSVIVKNFEAGSQLADTGLARGDCILEVDGVPVKGLAWTRKAIGGPIGSVVMLKVESSGDEFVVVVQRVKLPNDE